MTIQTEFRSAWNAMTSSILKRKSSWPERPTTFPAGPLVATPASCCQRAAGSKGVDCCSSTDFMGLSDGRGFASEHKAQLGLQRPRRHKMGSAEGGEEVVERHLVGEVDNLERRDEALTALRMRQVVGA